MVHPSKLITEDIYQIWNLLKSEKWLRRLSGAWNQDEWTTISL